MPALAFTQWEKLGGWRPLIVLFTAIVFEVILVETSLVSVRSTAMPLDAAGLLFQMLGVTLIALSVFRNDFRPGASNPDRVYSWVNQYQPLRVSGMYRVCRFPDALGGAFIVLGLGVAIGHWGALAALPLYVGCTQTLYISPCDAERLHQFGGHYRAYCRRVRPWI